MTTEATSETGIEAGAVSGMNPYTVALTWLWVGALAIAGILALMGLDAMDSDEADVALIRFTWATVFGSFGLSALLSWLLVNGIRWQAPQS